MNRTFTRGALFAVPVALALALGAMADSGAPPEHGRWAERRIEHMKEKLGLSDDQAQSIRTTFEANQDARRQAGEQLRQAMADFRKSALNGDDTSSLRKKRETAEQAYGRMLDLRAAELKKIGSILTPEQRTQFADMKHEGRGFGHGHHHGPPPPDDGAGPDDSPAAD